MSRYFWLIFGSLDHRTWQDFAGKCRTLKTQKSPPTSTISTDQRAFSCASPPGLEPNQTLI
nr:MAG TPA: hypothetical protein [Caudoviricetes sp.]